MILTTGNKIFKSEDATVQDLSLEEARDNYQLMVYAAGLMDDSTTEVRFRVVQPALKRVNSADIPGFMIRHWRDYVAKPCARAISLGIKGRNPGIHCLACCDPECPYFNPLFQPFT